jgi:hypothetical protein
MPLSVASFRARHALQNQPWLKLLVSASPVANY